MRCEVFWILRALLYLHFAVAKSADIQIPPENTAVMLGSAVHLNCTVVNSAQDILEWQEFQSQSTGTQISVNEKVNHPNSTRYTVQGQYNLVIPNSVKADGGKYKCKLVTANKERFAEVVVLAGKPHCEKVENGGNVQITCSIQYYGSMTPVAEWTDPAGTKLAAVKSASANTITYTATVNATQSIGQRYTCRMFFNAPSNVPPDTSTKTPDWTDSCLTTPEKKDKDTLYYTQQPKAVSSGQLITPCLTSVLVMLIVSFDIISVLKLS